MNCAVGLYNEFATTFRCRQPVHLGKRPAIGAADGHLECACTTSDFTVCDDHAATTRLYCRQLIADDTESSCSRLISPCSMQSQWRKLSVASDAAWLQLISSGGMMRRISSGPIGNATPVPEPSAGTAPRHGRDVARRVPLAQNAVPARVTSPPRLRSRPDPGLDGFFIDTAYTG